MAKFDNPLFGCKFVAGVTSYEEYYRPQDETINPRMVITVFIENLVTTRAILDTGSPWCIIDPEIAGLLGEELTDYNAEDTWVRGIRYKGKLRRMTITLQAATGSAIDIDATVFVPQLAPEEQWPHPNFVGLRGFLERIRFAVDPEEKAFYFARAEGDPCDE